jgi:uncharacterized lipoprotein
MLKVMLIPISIITMFFLISCSSVNYVVKPIKKLQTSKIYNKNFKTVWEATYTAVSETADIEIAEDSEGIIKTDWNHTTSDINVVEYEVDDVVKTKALKIRYRYLVLVKKIKNKTRVEIESEQEYEEFDPEEPEVSTNSWVATKSSTVRENAILKLLDKRL